MRTELLYSILGDISEERILAAHRSFHPWLCVIAILLSAVFTFGLSWVVEAAALEADRTETIYILPADESPEALMGFLAALEASPVSGAEISVHLPGDPSEVINHFGNPRGTWAVNSASATILAGRTFNLYELNEGSKVALEAGWGYGDTIPAGRTFQIGGSDYTVVGGIHGDVGDRTVPLSAYLSEGLGTDCVHLSFSAKLLPLERAAVYRLVREEFGEDSEYYPLRTHDNNQAASRALIALITLFLCGAMALSYSAILRRREGLDGQPGRYALARADKVALRYAAWVFLGGLLGLIASGLTVVVLDAANILYAWLCPAALNTLLGWLLIRR